MHSHYNVRCPRWRWNADSIHPCDCLVSCVTLSVFQLYLEHLTFVGNASFVNWNVSSVIWNASSSNNSKAH